jgi:hypothetical protein
VPTSTVEDQQGDGTDADAFADFGQMFVHGVDTDYRHDQGGAGAARRADRAAQVGPGEPSVAPDARTRAALGPDAGQRASAFRRGLHPETRFRPAGRQAPAGLRRAPARQSFFKSFLCLKVALRVHGTPRHAAEIQLLQQLADAALTRRYREDWWLTSQSRANRSLKRDSLLTGKRTGNFGIMAQLPQA